MKIYLSTKAKYPNVFNSDYIIHSKNFKLTTFSQSGLFEEEFLYMALYSESTSDISINLILGGRK